MKMFGLFFVFTLLVITRIQASDSTNTGSIFTANPGSCVTVPSCGAGQCGGYSGTNLVYFCNSGYTAFPDVINFRITKLPFGSQFTNAHTDPAAETCGGGVTCFGGTTTCQQSRLPAQPDNYLTWHSNINQLPANITCNYFNPTCNSCYTSYTGSCYTCPPVDTTTTE